MSRHRYFFLTLSSIVAVAVLWGIWRYRGTHLPCCDALGYGVFGASIREVGLWKHFLGSDYRTFGFPPWHCHVNRVEPQRPAWIPFQAAALAVSHTLNASFRNRLNVSLLHK